MCAWHEHFVIFPYWISKKLNTSPVVLFVVVEWRKSMLIRFYIHYHTIYTYYNMFNGVRVTRSLVLCVCYVDRCLSVWSLCCLLVFDIRILITPLVSSNSSVMKNYVIIQFHTIRYNYHILYNYSFLASSIQVIIDSIYFYGLTNINKINNCVIILFKSCILKIHDHSYFEKHKC